MMKLIKLTKIIAVSSLLTGCASISSRSEFAPPQGTLFSKIKAPISTDFDVTVIKEDHGSVSSLYFYDFIFTGLSFAWRDCSAGSCGKSGKLKAS